MNLNQNPLVIFKSQGPLKNFRHLCEPPIHFYKSSSIHTLAAPHKVTRSDSSMFVPHPLSSVPSSYIRVPADSWKLQACSCLRALAAWGALFPGCLFLCHQHFLLPGLPDCRYCPPSCASHHTFSLWFAVWLLSTFSRTLFYKYESVRIGVYVYICIYLVFLRRL